MIPVTHPRVSRINAKSDTPSNPSKMLRLHEADRHPSALRYVILPSLPSTFDFVTLNKAPAVKRGAFELNSPIQPSLKQRPKSTRQTSQLHTFPHSIIPSPTTPLCTYTHCIAEEGSCSFISQPRCKAVQEALQLHQFLYDTTKRV